MKVESRWRPIINLINENLALYPCDIPFQAKMSSDEDLCSSRREKFTTEKPINIYETSNISTGSDYGDLYGPVLPPHLMRKSTDNEKLKELSGSFGPELPVNYGSFRTIEQSQANEVDSPRITAHDSGCKIIGPEIPAQFLPRQDSDEKKEEEVKSEEEDEGGYGPSLSLMALERTGTEALTSSLCISKRKESPGGAAKRESWMVELPCEKAKSFGLGPRHFRSRLPNEKESDQSVWTETPMDKEKGLSQLEKAKRKDAEIIAQKQIEERNEEMEKLVKKLEKKRKRDKSLLEIHRKIKKKEKKEAKKLKQEGTAQRRPFDRNIDLQVQKFDLAQKNAVLRKAALLNDRFARGESKFL